MKYSLYIPARLGSKRLKNKILLKINEKCLIEHVFHRGLISKCFKNINIVTSDNILKKNIKLIKNIRILKSKQKHDSGISRVIEKIRKNEKLIFILFADELLIQPQDIKKFVKKVEKDKKNIVWNAVTKVSREELSSRSCVKCIINKNQQITDFKRILKNKDLNYKKSVGLFALRTNNKINLNNLKIKKEYKKYKIEQFMFLNNDINLKSVLLKDVENSINTHKDFKKAEKILQKNELQKRIFNKYL